MKFIYTRHNLNAKEQRLERLFEIIPGGLSWLIILGMTALSFFKPLIAMVIVIAFVLYWLMRMIYMNILLAISCARFKVEKNTDWMKRMQGIDRLCDKERPFVREYGKGNWYSRISAFIYRRQLLKLLRSRNLPPPSDDIYHVVIIPVIKEAEEIVRPGIESIVRGSYPCEKILLIIALEERAAEPIQRQMYHLQETYRSHFWDFQVIVHPKDAPGEARVKGANTTYAARKAAAWLQQRAIPYENVIASCFDADTVVPQDYFSCLTYYFMVTPDRIRASFQPIPMYFNNIWDAPSFARIIDVGISFFQFIEATDSRKLITFSSHSMSFKALSDIDYWPVDIISDDSAIFWKAFIYFDGDYQTIPIPVSLSMDIVTGRNIPETFINVYKQKRRWAWGVENFPIVLRGFLHTNTISLYKKINHLFKLLDKQVSWATWSFLLTFVSWLPFVFARNEFSDTTMYYIAPRIRLTMFMLASVGLVTCILISLMLLPPEKSRFSVLRKIKHAAEWLLIPVVVLFLSALPALDAQTRLMLGGYMEFWVTDKYRPNQGK